MSWAGGVTVDMRVERVEEPRVFGFTWQLHELPEDDPRRTYAEFTLEPAGDGTRLRVVETVLPSCHRTSTARRSTATPRGGRASWVNWPATSTSADIFDAG